MNDINPAPEPPSEEPDLSVVRQYVSPPWRRVADLLPPMDEQSTEDYATRIVRAIIHAEELDKACSPLTDEGEVLSAQEIRANVIESLLRDWPAERANVGDFA